MSKVTLHCQGVPAQVGPFLATAGATHVKCIGNYATFPGVTLIGRVYIDQAQVNGLVAAGASGAVQAWNMISDEVKKNGQVDIWETPANEPDPRNAAVMGGFVAFNQKLIELAHGAGKKIIVGALSVGWPYLPKDDGGVQMDILQRASVGAEGVSLHEYHPSDMRQSGYYCLRYRHFHDWCVSNGRTHPLIYITECGIDRGGCADCGWLSPTTINGNIGEYVSQLVWYETELQKDSYVACATIFTAGNSGWPTFETTPALCNALAPALAAVEPGPTPEPPEPPEPPPPLPEPVPVEQMARGFYASEYQSISPDDDENDTGDWIDIDFQAAKEAGYSFVFIRTGSGLHKDLRFDHNWEAAGEAGLIRAAWHYLHPTVSTQSAFASSILGDREPEIGVFFIDLEADTTKAKADQWFGAFGRNFPDLWPGYYTNWNWANKNGGVAAYADFLLWVANWTDGDSPLLPEGADEWAFWQWSSQLPAGGPFPAPYLPNRFVGSEDDLYEWCDIEQEEPVAVRIIDMDGNVRDWAWLVANYGDGVQISPIGGDGYRVIQLTEIEGWIGFTCTVLNEGGGPVAGQRVAYKHGTDTDIEITKGSGVAEHTAGGGERYTPGQDTGAVTWQVLDAASEAISGLGWINGTQYQHLQVMMRWNGGEPPTPEPPAAPTDLTVVGVSSDEIDLIWTDNSAGTGKFRIERCTGAGCTDFVMVATRPAGTTNYEGIGLASSTTYRYRVQAYNDAGSSAYSNLAGATTAESPSNGCDLTEVLEKLDILQQSINALSMDTAAILTKLSLIEDRLAGPWTVTAE